MKALILFLFSLFTFSCFSQTSIYHPFPESGAIWNHYYIYICPPMAFCNEHGEFSYVMNGDTVINSISYHKIVCPYVNCNTSQCNRPSGYIGAIRQDVANKKVYFADSSSDKLLYDFNLQVGDTATTGGITYRVHTIDSVFVNSGYRKRWITYPLGISGVNNGFIIEGIGSDVSLFRLYQHISGSGFSNNDKVVCMTVNDTIYYHPDTNFSCSETSSIPVISNSQINVYPNPVSGKTFTIEKGDFEKMELTLYNILGELVLTEKIDSKVTEINRENIKNGIYLYRIKNEKAGIVTGKIILQ